MQTNLKERAFGRALRETEQLITGKLWFQLLYGSVSIAVAAMERSIAPGFATLFGGALVVLVVQLLRAPYLQRNEARRAVEQSERDRRDQEERERMGRPFLQVEPFKMEPPFFRESPLMQEGVGAGGRIRRVRVGTGYYINIRLTNTGVGVVRGCQPMLTAWGRRSDNNEWTCTANWLPIGLQWVLDEAATHVSGAPTEERNLVPHRPYLINLGTIATTDPNCFHLLLVIESFGQDNHFQAGEYCFEITIYAENIDPVQKWYRVMWGGGLTKNPSIQEAREKLVVEELELAPWSGAGLSG